MTDTENRINPFQRHFFSVMSVVPDIYNSNLLIVHDTVIPYGTENKLFYFLFFIRMLLSCHITGWLECCSSFTWLHYYCRMLLVCHLSGALKCCSPVKWLKDWIVALLPNDWRIGLLLFAKWLEDWIVALCQMTGGLDCCSLPNDWRIRMLLSCQITRGLECCSRLEGCPGRN